MINESVEKIAGGLARKDPTQEEWKQLLANHRRARGAFQMGRPEYEKVLTTIAGDDKASVTLLDFLLTYFQHVREIPDVKDMGMYLRQKGQDDQLVQEVQALYSAVLDGPFTKEGTFLTWLTTSADVAGRYTLAPKLLRALSILEDGSYEEGVKLLGSMDACKYLDKALGEHRRLFIKDTVKRGDIRLEAAEMKAEVRAAKEGDSKTMFPSHFKAIDRRITGFQTTNLVMIGAATGEGKSQLAHNIAYNVATLSSKNVLYITMETSREIIRRRLSTLQTRKVTRGGLLYDKIKTGELSPDELAQFDETVDNWKMLGGAISVVEMAAPTMLEVADEIKIYNDAYGVPADMVILDYPALMTPTVRRRTSNEEESQLLKEAKNLAGSANSGEGTVLVACHQLKPARREVVTFEEGNFYTIRDFANTSEASKSADIAMAILRTDEMREENCIGVKIVKARDSDPGSMFRMFALFSKSYIGNLDE